MEPGFGKDFSRVQIHTDSRAAESARVTNALAYTVGQDIVFDVGQYAPVTDRGKRLLAHELAHVVQQQHASHSAAMTEAGSAQERSADDAAEQVMVQGRIPSVVSAGLGIARLQPEIESSKRVRYEPHERESSGSSLGGIDRVGDYEFLLFDYGVNDAVLKPDHKQFLEMLVSDFQLNKKEPKAFVRLIRGYTDLVDTERVNKRLRQMRAESVIQYLVMELGVRRANIDTSTGASPGSLIADNSTSSGRARNRSVVIQLEPLPEVKSQKFEMERRVIRSTKWKLTSVTSGAFGAIVGGGGGLFVLEERSTGKQRNILFVGVGLAGGASLEKLPGIPANKFIPPRLTASWPNGTDFETTEPHTFRDFEGFGFIDMLSADVIAVGYQFGWAHFNPGRIHTTDNKGIYIGGVQFGGFGLSAAALLGEWSFVGI